MKTPTARELRDAVIKVVRGHSGLSIRKIEAYVVLEDVDISTFTLQCMVNKLENEGLLIEDDNFLYRCKDES